MGTSKNIHKKEVNAMKNAMNKRLAIWTLLGVSIVSVVLYFSKKSTNNTDEIDTPAKRDIPLDENRQKNRRQELDNTPSPLPLKEPNFVMVDNRKVYRNPTNDVGRVVTNAFGKALVIERVLSPSGPRKNGKSLVPRRIFTYDSEVAIDTLMNMEIGERSLMMLPANMDQDFLNSMSSKIIIEPDDTENEIRRKKDMIAIKKELAERVANGEKVSEIAAETLAHYNKVATIRDNLLQEIYNLEENGATEDEIEDIYEAANIMLKEYDAQPLHSPKVRKAIIRERLERNKARQQQKSN